MSPTQSNDTIHQQLVHRYGEDYSIWDDRIICDARTSAAQISYIRWHRAEERIAIQCQMEADHEPDWLIEMVLQQWGKWRRKNT